MKHLVIKPNLYAAELLNGSRIMEILGATPPIPVSRPANFVCPKCNGTLTLYYDDRYGDWCFCHDCKLAGDVLELVCSAWGMSPVQTFAKLRKLGVAVPDWSLDDDIVSHYQSDVLDRRQTINNLWQTASQSTYQDNSVVRKLHDQLCLDSRSNPARWRQQMSKFIGSTTAKAVESAFRPLSSEYKIVGWDRIFKGRCWRDVIIMPAYSAPGRISGFWFVGRQCRWPVDWVFKRAGSVNDNYRRETGVAMFDSVMEGNNTFGETAFVVNHPWLALRLHDRYVRDHGDSLPLVVAHDAGQSVCRIAWKHLPRRRWTFWAESPTLSLLAQAKAAEARITIEPIVHDDAVRRCTTWLKVIADRARPWYEVFADESQRMSDEKLEAAIETMCLTEEQLRNLRGEIKQAVIDRCLENVEFGRKGRRTAFIGEYVVSEQPGGWFLQRWNYCISNVIVRIDEIRVNNQTTPLIYKGYFKFNDVQIPFEVEATKLRQHTAEFIEDSIVKAGLGLPKLDPTWQNKLVDIAMYFHEPKIRFGGRHEFRTASAMDDTKRLAGSNRSGQRNNRSLERKNVSTLHATSQRNCKRNRR